MSDDPAPATRLDAFKALMASRRFLGSLAVAAALALVVVAGYRQLVLKPLRVVVEKRTRTHNAMIKLYDMQMAYRARYGAYANDLETLLASSPEGPAARALLQANADMNTLTVVGDAQRFRLEANVLDPQRTILKIRGPFPSETRERRPPPRELPEAISAP